MSVSTGAYSTYQLLVALDKVLHQGMLGNLKCVGIISPLLRGEIIFGCTTRLRISYEALSRVFNAAD